MSTKPSPDSIHADVREAIEKAWEDAFDAYCKECGDSSAHQAACISIRSALAPFFAARDEEIARLKDRLLASQQEVEIAQQMRESDSYHLKRQLAEAQRDSKRLDWLLSIDTKHAGVIVESEHHAYGNLGFPLKDHAERSTATDWLLSRSAIDAAMQQEVKQ